MSAAEQQSTGERKRAKRDPGYIKQSCQQKRQQQIMNQNCTWHRIRKPQMNDPIEIYRAKDDDRPQRTNKSIE